MEGPNRGGLSCESCSVNRHSSMENFFCWWRDLAHPRLSFKFNQGVGHCSQYTSLCTWLQEVCRDSINTRCLPFRMSRVLYLREREPQPSCTAASIAPPGSFSRNVVFLLCAFRISHALPIPLVLCRERRIAYGLVAVANTSYARCRKIG